MSNNENAWSDWLDFNDENIAKIPQLEGAFVMHASMKILFIGGSENMRFSIQEKKNESCTSIATRVKFMKTLSYKQITLDLIKDYQDRHQGKMPQCM
ncbi:MAG: hypothetical protein ACKVN8_06085 [Nitrosarchaeum sp.]